MKEKEPSLVIMAAGMGSRYGGLKQIDPVGKNNELIIDFSIFDAIRAGFKKVIFIIKKQDEKDFKEAIGNRMSEVIQTAYVYQELEDLPKAYTVPDGRTKPWGTGHALRACRNVINEPFAVINADDYYGSEAFCKMYQFLKGIDDTTAAYAMVGYTLKNTLTPYGHVARGICSEENGMLTTICERIHIAYHEGEVAYLEDGHFTPLHEESIVSMNLWGFTPCIFEALEETFSQFFEGEVKDNPLKSEYFLPSVVDKLIKEQKATVNVLRSSDRWYGVTYKEDKPFVVEAIATLQNDGVYPYKLWEVE